jgi:hypothetical protein
MATRREISMRLFDWSIVLNLALLFSHDYFTSRAIGRLQDQIVTLAEVQRQTIELMVGKPDVRKLD